MYQHSRRRQLTVLAALLAASIVCITIDFRQPDGGPVDRLQRLAIAAFGPLQRGASAVVRPVAGLAGEVAELGRLRDDNRRLEAEVAWSRCCWSPCPRACGTCRCWPASATATWPRATGSAR